MNFFCNSLQLQSYISRLLQQFQFFLFRFLNWASNCSSQIIFSLGRLSQSAGAALEVAIDLACGVVSGWSQVFIMQPFEIIKIRLANQSLASPEYSGIVDCFKKIKIQEGVNAFYRGTLSPLVGVGPHVALQFASNQFIRKLLLKLQGKQNSDSSPPIQLAFASGCLSGIPSALVATPVDLTRIQIQRGGGDKEYRGSFDAARKIYTTHGIKGLYTGFYPTLMREVIALSFYFGVYQVGMKLLDPLGKSSANAPLEAAFFMGGIAGAASWVFSYPIDYVKTLVQSQSIYRREFSSASNCALIKYKEEGYKTFYKGLGVTILRSFPVNGCGFLIFQTLKRMMGHKRNPNENITEL